MKNEGKWDLSVLYSSFDDEKFTADMAALEREAESLGAAARNAGSLSTAELLREYIKRRERIGELSSSLYSFASLTHSADTRDAQSATAIGKIMQYLAGTAGPIAAFEKIIAKRDDVTAVVSADEELKEYSFFIESILKNSKYLLSEGEETMFSTMNTTGASAWEELHGALTSSLTVDMRGESITLSEARNLAYSTDANERRDAYAAELAAYEKIKEPVAHALSAIKMQVINECRLRGYSSPLDQALTASRMSAETLDALLEAITRYLPAFRRYLRAKARLLGHEGALPWYDLFAPVGNMTKKFTAEEARDYLLSSFEGFDGEMYELIRASFDEGRIDLYPREGKVGGAFDAGLPTVGESRVLTNFDGSYSSVTTLAHELGHSFHDKQVFSHSILNQDYTMPVAETASTFNEILLMERALTEAKTKDEKLALLEGQLMDSCQIITDIYSRYLFESKVFAAREDEFLNADRFSEMMTEAQKAAYGDGLCEDVMHPYMWLCKGHYYSGSLSFYNFPYAFGGLFARGLYAKYREMGESFVPVYKKMLSSTGVMSVEDAARIVGVDLTRVEFWSTGLAELAAKIDEFEALVNE